MKLNKNNVFVGDFETTPQAQYEIEGRTRVYLFEYKNIKNTIKRVGISIEEFFNSLYELKQNIIMYFHNGSNFDFEFIMWYLFENNFKNVASEKELDNFCFTSIITDLKRIYNLKLKYNNYTIEFRCSYLILPTTIKKMGKSLGLEKLDETHNYTELKNFNSIEEVTEEELNYLENDVEILRLAIIFALDNGLTKLTIASSAYNRLKQKNYFAFRDIYEITDEYQRYIIDKSYKGGIVQVNKKYACKEINEPFISLDVNSLYPFIMMSNSMPIGEPKYYTDIQDYYNSSYKKAIIHIYVEKAKIIDGCIPFIPSKGIQRYGASYEYEEYLESVDLYLWEEKFELFKNFYIAEYDIVEVLAFKEKKDFFKDYLEDLFSMKENAKDEFIRLIAKLLMNSTYGKFAMKQKQLMSIPYMNEETGMIEYMMVEEDGKYYAKEIASYITSQASNYWVEMVECNADRFIYGDTDSVYLMGTELPEFCDIDSKRIGAWKLEHIYPKGKFLKAKCYIKTLEDGTIDGAIAGLPKDARWLINYNNFEIGLTLKDCKNVSKRVKGGVIITKTDFSIKVN